MARSVFNGGTRTASSSVICGAIGDQRRAIAPSNLKKTYGDFSRGNPHQCQTKSTGAMIEGGAEKGTKPVSK